MSEKIYLGFAGKYNIRLGESLKITNDCIGLMKNISGKIDFNKLEAKFSNIYIMYNINEFSKLSMLVSQCLNMQVICEPTVNYDYRKNLLDTQKDEDYIISFNIFNFLNEKVWPRIVSSFIDAIQKNKNSFILKLKIPFEKIDTLYQNYEIKEKNNLFINEINRWLTFQAIGYAVMVSEEEHILEIDIRVSY